MGRNTTPTTTRAKLLTTAAAIGATAAVAGLGTFGTWTSTTTAQTPTYASGTVVLDYGATGTTNRLSTGASDMAPGDTAQRGFTLRNAGTIDFAFVALNVTAPTSSALDTDATNGLTLAIDKCSSGWTESLSTPYTYTCTGTVSTVLAATPVANLKTTATTLAGLSSLSVNTSDSLRATFTLPTASANTTQGLTSTLSISFTGTQRTGTAK